LTYTISRDGQEFGPYSLSDVQRYVGTGNILLTDLARAEGTTEWISVAQVVGTIAVPPPTTIVPNAYAAASQYPDPPNLHWGLTILFAVLTCGLFIYAWDIVQALYVKRIDPASKALMYYIPGFALLVLSIVLAFTDHNVDSLGRIFNLAGAVLLIVGRFNLRSSLEQHFTTVEPIGLTLSGVMTFFFGPLYFQYHFNRINEIKRAARLANPY
jgi:hypothetical protein